MFKYLKNYGLNEYTDGKCQERNRSDCLFAFLFFEKDQKQYLKGKIQWMGLIGDWERIESFQ